MIILLIPILTSTGFAQPSWPPWTLPLRQAIEHHRKFQIYPLPALVFDASLPANARFANDTIFLGQVQADFHTRGDSLSLLFHEYLHGFFQATSRFVYDTAGTIPQWETDEWEIYHPPRKQVNLTLQLLDLEGDARKKMRKKLAAADRLPFHYAPSLLAREERLAYHMQLQYAGKFGYRLSPEARTALRIRLLQLRQTYLRRRMYEKKHALTPNGISRKPT